MAEIIATYDSAIVLLTVTSQVALRTSIHPVDSRLTWSTLVVPYYYYYYYYYWPPALHSQGLYKLLRTKSRTKCVSAGYVEWMGEADCIEALDCNIKALEYKEYFDVSRGRKSMVESRNEVSADLVYRTERLECNGEEMIVAGESNIFLFFLILLFLPLVLLSQGRR